MFEDRTKNQHFIAQFEQKYNAINPSLNKEKRKIYAFEIIDREKDIFKCTNANGIKIEKNLTIYDLFTFDVMDEGIRANFEKFFGKYESRAGILIDSFIKKIDRFDSDIGYEVINIFALKFLNFIRNPYSIEKISNTFSDLKKYVPANPQILENYQKVLQAKNPEIEGICSQLQINQELYKDWLGIIFLLLTLFNENNENFLDLLVKEIFNVEKNIINIYIFKYTQDVCLLTDRGWVNLSDEDLMLNFSFNVTKNIFISFSFTPKDEVENLLNKELNKFQPIMSKIFQNIRRSNFEIIEDNIDILKKYNSNCITQCYKHVFCAKKEFKLMD